MQASKEQWNRRQGGIALEAALAVPPVLFLIALFLQGLIYEQEKLHLTRAVDRAAAEIALVMPVASLGQSWLNARLEDSLSAIVLTDTVLDGSREALGGELLEWVAAFERVGLQVFARSRIQYWLAQENGKGLQQDAMTVSVAWDKDPRRGWLIVQYKRSWSGMEFGSTIRSLIPVWQTFKKDRPDHEEPSYDRIWELDNFSRGQAIRKQSAANLPDDFPVIARWFNGEATAIHSLDLTAPTYQDEQEVIRAVRRRLDRLAEFQGADYIRQERMVRIVATEIKTRCFILVVPQNHAQEWVSATIAGLQQEAAARGIRLELKELGESRKYQGHMDSDQSD